MESKMDTGSEVVGRGGEGMGNLKWRKSQENGGGGDDDIQD
jgi:hypothetical protein